MTIEAKFKSSRAPHFSAWKNHLRKETQMFARTLFVVTVSAGLTCAAQDVASLAGTWSGAFALPSGQSREAKIVITGETGTWQTNARNRENPCIGREFPLDVLNVTPTSFDLAVNSSKSLSGCPDGKFQLKRVDDKTYEGQFADGRKLVLSRK